ncbi:MAG: Lrp/AsnC family transcriptional regulator [Candidatus Dormibacteria bacterium]
MDDTDRQLLGLLAAGGRSTWAALGERVSLSAPSVHERVHKLESSGTILAYSALVDPERVGAETAALVAIRIQGPSEDRRRLELELAREPAVLELHEVAGDDCYMAKVRVQSAAQLAGLLASLRDHHPGISSRSSVVLRTVFERPLLWPGDRPPPLGQVQGVPS